MRVPQIVAAILLVSASAAGAKPPTNTFTTIDYPGFRGTTTVTGINNAGRLIGSFTVPRTQYTFGFTETAGVYSLLPSVGCRTAHCDTTPLAINSHGDIAGEFSDDPAHREVFLIHHGVLQLLPIPDSSELALLGGLNERGDVAGYFQTSTGRIRVFIYSKSTVTVPAMPADFIDATAQAINNGGEITGSYDDARGLHGYIDKHGKVTRFDVPGGSNTSPVAINEGGDVVGNYSTRSATGVVSQHGFAYSHGHIVTFDFPGGVNTLPTAINDADMIAGTYQNPAVKPPFNTSAFVAIKGRFARLPVPALLRVSPESLRTARWWGRISIQAAR